MSNESHRPITIDLNGPVDILELAAAVCRVVPEVAVAIGEGRTDTVESLIGILDALTERVSAEAHAFCQGLKITGTAVEGES